MTQHPALPPRARAAAVSAPLVLLLATAAAGCVQLSEPGRPLPHAPASASAVDGKDRHAPRREHGPGRDAVSPAGLAAEVSPGAVAPAPASSSGPVDRPARPGAPAPARPGGGGQSAPAPKPSPGRTSSPSAPPQPSGPPPPPPSPSPSAPSPAPPPRPAGGRG